MEQIRQVRAAPEYVRASLNSVKADLPILQDHLADVKLEIDSIKNQLQQIQRTQR